jgi:hypothetical protein
MIAPSRGILPYCYVPLGRRFDHDESKWLWPSDRKQQRCGSRNKARRARSRESRPETPTWRGRAPHDRADMSQMRPIIALGDTIRIGPSPRRRQPAQGGKPVPVTGGNERAALWVPRELGIEEVHARRFAAGPGRHRAKTSDRRSGRHRWRRYQ